MSSLAGGMGGKTPGAPGNIALIGFMGSGKSTVGAALASILNEDFIDLDTVISRRASMSIREIFAQRGEEGFRELEHEALKSVMVREGMILACGGGLVLREDNVQLLRERCIVFFLDISTEEALRRLSNGEERPLLDCGPLEATVASLMSERAYAYASAAHEVIVADVMTPQEIAEEIVERWRKYVQ